MNELSHQGAYRLIHQNHRNTAEAEALRRHLRTCVECRQHAAASALMSRRLTLQPAQQHPSPDQTADFVRRATRHRHWNFVVRPLSTAAALAVLALVVFIGWHVTRTTSLVPDPVDADLIMAIETGDTVKLESLLSALRNPTFRTSDGTGLLPLAAQWGQLETVRLLLEKGADASETRNASGTGRTALMEAALNNHLDVADLLITTGVDINQKRAGTGYTALHDAAGQSNIDVVVDLLEHGADPNLQAENGTTPLYLAARYGYVYTARALLDGGADINMPDREGITPLMAAIIRGRVIDRSLERIVTLLLLRGADPNRQDSRGNTALHYAVETNMIDAIPILIEHGASPDIKNNEGKTPLDLASYDLTAATLRAAAAKTTGQ